MEPEFIDEEERIPLLHDNIGDDSTYEDSQAETSFSDVQQEATEAELRLRERHLEKKDKRINALESRFPAVICKLKNLQENTSASQNPTANFSQKAPCEHG